MTRRPILPIAMAAALVLALLAVSVAAAQSQRAFVGKLTMTGDQEVVGDCKPPQVCGDPDATGTARIHIVPALDRVCFRLEWSQIDGTVWGAHIHGPATRQDAAPIVVPLFMRDPTNPSTHFAGTDSTAGCVVSEAWADTIAADPAHYYVNVHSTVFGPGAIRAQLAD